MHSCSKRSPHCRGIRAVCERCCTTRKPTATSRAFRFLHKRGSYNFLSNRLSTGDSVEGLAVLQLPDTFKKTQSGICNRFPTESLLSHPSRTARRWYSLPFHADNLKQSVHDLYQVLLRIHHRPLLGERFSWPGNNRQGDRALPLSYGTHRPGGIRTRDLLVMSEVSLHFTTGRIHIRFVAPATRRQLRGATRSRSYRPAVASGRIHAHHCAGTHRPDSNIAGEQAKRVSTEGHQQVLFASGLRPCPCRSFFR
jgi:hypothetical protein